MPADHTTENAEDHSSEVRMSPDLTTQQDLNILSESEGKYRRLIEGISGDYVIYTHDPEGTLTYVSPSIEHVLGFAPDKVIGLNWRDLVGEHFIGRSDADRVREEVDAGKKYYKFQVEISHADGSRRLVEVQQRPLFDNNKYISMEGIAKDITETVRNAQELKRLKEELEQRVVERTEELSLKNELLHESERRYRSMVEDQAEFVVQWLPGGELTFANGAYCRYFDKKTDEILGHSFFPTVHEEDRGLVELHINTLSQETPHASIQHRVLRPDGSIGWTEWTNRAMFDEQGNLYEYQSVGRDITALKIAADTIREKETHLAHVSRLATMGELVAGIAHEVHQPLHAAKTFAEAARRALEAGLANSTETAIDCTKEISEAVNRTATIIRRLRDFATSKPMTMEVLDLNLLVKEASKIIAYETRQAQVKLIMDLAPSEIVIQGDSVQLEQACVNLFINAYDAMKEKPVEDRKLYIQSKIIDKQAILSVKDSGCGVAIENLVRIFDAFYTTKSGGMGMGLSLCKSIAEAHGGDIRAENNDTNGMTFTLSLPQAQSVADIPNTN